MDLYGRRIVGWEVSKRMTTDLISKALTRAYKIRNPPKGLVFHSDRGSQYTSKSYRDLLEKYGIRSSMGDVGIMPLSNDFLEVLSMIGYLKYHNRLVPI